MPTDIEIHSNGIERVRIHVTAATPFRPLERFQRCTFIPALTHFFVTPVLRVIIPFIRDAHADRLRSRAHHRGLLLARDARHAGEKECAENPPKYDLTPA